MKKRRKKQPSKNLSYSTFEHNSSISSKLKTQKCVSSTSGTILSMYENNSLPLTRYDYYQMHSNASTTLHVINQNDNFTSCPQTTSKIYRSQEQKRKLKYALDTYFRNLLCKGVSDFRDVSINLPIYLEKALNEVFVQLDSTKDGRIMFSDFEKLCEEFGFANSHYNGKNYQKLIKDAKETRQTLY